MALKRMGIVGNYEVSKYLAGYATISLFHRTLDSSLS